MSTAASRINASALLLATGLFLLIGVGSIWVWVFPNIAALLIIAAISRRIKNVPALTQPELMEIRYDLMIGAPVAYIPSKLEWDRYVERLKTASSK